MICVINFGNDLIIRILNKAAILAIGERLAKRLHFSHVVLKQPKARSNYFAGGAVSAANELGGNELIKMSPKSNAGIFAHRYTLLKVPIIGILWYKTHNQANVGKKGDRFIIKLQIQYL